MTEPVDPTALPPGFNPMRDLQQDGLIRSLRLMASMFGHGPRESNARYAADELERVILEKRHLIHEVTRLRELIETPQESIRANVLELGAVIGRLCAVIAKAPHEPECQTWQPEDWPWSRDCTCWKADAVLPVDTAPRRTGDE